MQCIYIDPPYNTGNDGFLYKDNYQHSSWLAMMTDRIRASSRLLSEGAPISISIDAQKNSERHRLSLLIEDLDPLQEIGELVWKTRNTDNRIKEHLSIDHEYVVVATPKGSPIAGRTIDRSHFNNPDNDPRGPYTTDPLTGKANALERPRLHNTITDERTGRQYPPDPDLGWITDPAGFERLLSDNRVVWPQKATSGTPRKKRFKSESEPRMPVSSLGLSVKQGEEGNQVLYDLFGSTPMNYTKPLVLMRSILDCLIGRGLVVDFFAGSGTTAHAAMANNILAGSDIRFILTEVASHFHTVLLPRVQKGMHSIDWKDGIPVSRKGPVGIVQVLALESYDDTLDNLDLRVMDGLQATLTASPDFARDYTLRYQVEHEAQHGTLALSRDLFTEKPFDRTLRVTRDDALTTVPVDLVETFHWLVGLTVRTRRVEAQVRVSRGTLPDGAEAVVLWRDPAVVSDEVFEQWFATAMVPTLDGVSTVWAPSAAQLGRHRPSNASWSLEGLETTFLARMFDATEA